MVHEPAVLPEDAARRVEYAAMVADAQLAEAIKIVDARGIKGEARAVMAFSLMAAISRNYAASLK